MGHLHSEKNATVALIAPASVTGTAQTPWIGLGQFHQFGAEVLLGAGAGDVDAKIEVATAADGAGATDLRNGTAETVPAADADGKTILFDVEVPPAFGYARLTVTTGGARDVSGRIAGHGPRYSPVTQPDHVLQTVRAIETGE